jgi:hypothetical protein
VSDHRSELPRSSLPHSHMPFSTKKLSWPIMHPTALRKVPEPSAWLALLPRNALRLSARCLPHGR